MLWPVVHGFCARAVPEGDADDAAQLVMEKVFAQASRYDRKRPALPWVLAIAAWECRTLRKRRLRRREESIERAADAAAAESPEDAAVQRQLQELAYGVLGQLSHADQQALASAYADHVGMTGAVSGATLRKRKARALQRLRDAWRKLHGD